MTYFVPSDNAAGLGKLRSMFRRRELFVHDGRSLRRLTLRPSLQIMAIVTLSLLILWSLFAATRLAAQPVSKDRSAEIAQMRSQVRAMRADVAAIKQVADARLDLTEAEVRKLGLKPERFTGQDSTGQQFTGQGGPLEAVAPLRQAADRTFKQLFTSWKKLDSLEKATIAIPSVQPVGGANLTSSYGVRSDPFRGRAAMHAGIDLAGPIGSPIYATADGFVARSEWAGGYGNLVELTHGSGIQTRYGHLSRSLVKAGEPVKRGQLIAYMGSTGRSTGSHLHYEVRIDGKAVNPIPFMQGNDYLLAVQRRAAAAETQVAMGGPETAQK